MFQPAITKEDDSLTEYTAKGGRLKQHSFTKFRLGLRERPN